MNEYKQMPKQTPRVTIMQPSAAPYRIALLSKLVPAFEVKVVYVAGEASAERVWSNKHPDTVAVAAPRFKSFTIFGKAVTWSRHGAAAASEATDIVVTCTNAPDAFTYLAATIIAKIRRKPVLCLVTIGSGYKFVRRNGVVAFCINAITRGLVNLIIRGADRAICYSESGMRLANELGKPARASSQYYPLEQEYGALAETDVEKWLTERSGREKIVACVIGYITPRKGIQELMELLQRTGLISQLELRIAGKLDMASPAIRTLVENAPSNVIFLGNLDGPQKSKLFRDADVMIFPTLHDSWGYVVNEAMYHGTPVLATGHSEAAKDLIEDQSNGWVYQSDQEFCDAISTIRDRDAYRPICLQAHRSVMNFNQNALANWRASIIETLGGERT